MSVQLSGRVVTSEAVSGARVPEATRLLGVEGSERSQFLLRAITPDESLVYGVRPMGPGLRAGQLAEGPLAHVHGVKPSEWVSFTKDLAVAQARAARTGGTVIEVNMRYATGEVLDLSAGWRGNPALMERLRSLGATQRQILSPRLEGFTLRDQEVLLKGFVSPDGIYGVP